MRKLLIPALVSVSLAIQAQPPAKQLQVRGTRILQHLQALSQYGKNPEGGVSRIAYSPADRQGREYVIGLMRDAGLDVSYGKHFAAYERIFERLGLDAEPPSVDALQRLHRRQVERITYETMWLHAGEAWGIHPVPSLRSSTGTLRRER